MNPTSIRPLKSAELELAVALLQAQLSEHHIAFNAQDSRNVVETIISHPDHGFILLASVGDQSVGVAYVAARLSLEHGGVIGWIEELYVTPAHRGFGIGSALVGEVLSRAGVFGWKGVELELLAGYERASHLYVRHGFHPRARRRYSRIFSDYVHSKAVREPASIHAVPVC